METTKSLVFPVKVKPGTVAVQISPGFPVPVAGDLYVLFHVQWKEVEGDAYRSTDLLMLRPGKEEEESFMLEEAATERTASFSGSKRPYYKAVKGDDGKWFFGAEGMPGHKLIAIEEGTGTQGSHQGVD